jgi:hypothetical protein
MVNIKYIKSLLFILFLTVVLPLKAQYTLSGIVTDSVTNEPLSFINVYFKGTTIGTRTNDDGIFMLKTNLKQARLVISSVGYNDYTKIIYPARESRFEVRLVPANIALKEVVIKPGREHYRKKDNPAVIFVRKLMEHRNDHSPDNHAYWSRNRYEKLLFALNNFNEEKQKKWIFRKFPFLQNYVDTSAVTKQPILPVSMREMLGADYYRKDPKGLKQIVEARKHAGIDEILSQQGMQTMVNEVFRDVNIYDDNITIFTNKFVSPLSRLGVSFYKYYLLDTLQVDNEKCVDLGFAPFNAESFGFTGHFYVTLDSTYFVKKVVMNFPKKINLNFVDYMILKQDFKRGEDGTRLLQNEEMTVEFKLSANSDGIYARRDVSYSNYSYDPPENLSVFKHPESVIEGINALTRPEEYWTTNRPPTPGMKTNSVENLMTELRSYPIYYWTEKILQIMFTGYVPTSKESPKFYIGPMNTMVSGNSLEGTRFRFGGMTTAWLNNHWFGKGYLAYGNKDKRMKGLGELEYSFAPKKEYANEFPIRSLKLNYETDVNQYGQYYLYTSKDNIFLTFKRKKDDRIGYIQKGELTWTNEYYSGFSFKLTARGKTEESSYLIPFTMLEKAGDTSGMSVDKIKTNEAEVTLRYAPHEKFYQTQWNRFPVNVDYPIFTLTHTIAVKDGIGTDYNYNHTEFGFQKRFWFSAFGYTDVILKAGKVWNKVPFPLLILPNANLSYTIQPESYSLMNAMEFINDEYASWDATYYLNGFVFNRIPLLRKLKWREVLSCRGMYGNLSDKNNPTLTNGLFQFPTGSNIMGNKPYIEVGAGIENVFKILRFDYVWRLTYRNLQGVDTSGLRISIHMTF